MARRELGEILREADLISEAQLHEALALQRVYGERIASILVRQKVLTEKFAVTYLGRQLGVPAVDLSKSEIDLALLDVFPLELCERHLAFPVRVDGGRLQLAMSEPTDHASVSELESRTGVRLTPMIALEAAIKNAVVEARRALKERRRTIAPNVQRPRDGAAPFQAPPRQDGAAIAPAAVQARALATVEARPAAVSAASSTPAPAPLPPIDPVQTVLVVDDDEAARALLSNLLEKRRCHVITASKGGEALARVREIQPDLVILDGMLPEIHGFEICRQIKASDRFRHIPVMLLSAVHTGWRFAGDVKEKYGADDYLEKPFDAGDLARRVDLLLGRAAGPAAEAEAESRRHLKDGVIAFKQDRLDDAIAAFGRGLAVDPFSDLLHYYLATAHEKKDAVFHAIDHYEKAIRINPDFYDAITRLAELYQHQKFTRKAAETWELALRAAKDENVRARIREHLLGLL